MLRNLRTEGMVVEDGPRLSGCFAPLRSVLDPGPQWPGSPRALHLGIILPGTRSAYPPVIPIPAPGDGVADSEVVGDLVDHRLVHQTLDLLLRPAVSADRLSIDEDLVGVGVPRAVVPLGQGTPL